MSRLDSTWLARFVLAVYLAVVPLQGIAGAIAALVCHSETAVAGAQSSNHHSQHPVPLHEPGSVAVGDVSNDDPAEAAYDGHLCCQLVVTALPSRATSIERPEFSPNPFSPDVFFYVTFLERFQRPPLA